MDSRALARRFLLLWFVALQPALGPVAAQTSDCLACHARMLEKKFVHGAVHKGCDACHADLDASVTPHKPKGRSATGQKAERQDACTGCHDAKEFNGRFVHAPVAEGKCSTCHDPHASDFVGLSRRPPAEQCLDCHPDVKKRPHVIVGFSAGGHPIGDAKKVAIDPLRAGKPFYCAACHEPHRSGHAMLMRFEGKGTATCQRCHKM